MSHQIRKDKHGLYIRAHGQIYRPQVPLEVSKKAAKTKMQVDMRVSLYPGADIKFMKVHFWDDPNFRSIDEVWFSHGRYITPTYKQYIESHDCWQPSEYRWA